jgi:hypothetical protein
LSRLGEIASLAARELRFEPNHFLFQPAASLDELAHFLLPSSRDPRTRPATSRGSWSVATT